MKQVASGTQQTRKAYHEEHEEREEHEGSQKMSLHVESPLPEATEQLIHQTIGAAIQVHRMLGPGFHESIYEKALCHELELQQIEFEAQKQIEIVYKGMLVGKQRIDLLIAQTVIVELKAVDALLPLHQAQIISYLRATHLQAGLLINFNVYRLKEGVRRVII